MDYNTIALLRSRNLLLDIDIQFAELMCRIAGDASSPELYLGAALVSSITTDEKHICLDLTELAGRPLAQFFSVRRDEAEAALGVALAPE
ncbi:MAG: hypothetical protein GY868_00495, partial [Deltaproteobacteria bacterium]|nr:hypothetical protein [Deltaproteobacteria bacterium]